MKTMVAWLLFFSVLVAPGHVRADGDCCKREKVAATLAAGRGGSGHRPRVQGVAHGETGYAGLRTAPRGTQNLVVCVGASPDGSYEHAYARAIHRIVGGAIFEGEFNQDDVASTIAGLGKTGTKVANIYFRERASGRSRARGRRTARWGCWAFRAAARPRRSG